VRDLHAYAMQHLVSARTVVGSGASSVLLEVRGGSVRIKRRGAPDMFLPVELAEELAAFFGELSRSPPSRAPDRSPREVRLRT